MPVAAALSFHKKNKLVADFKSAMAALYGDRLAKVMLYGSYARGEAGPDSDIDFLVVLNDPEVSTGLEIDRITDQVFGMILDYGIDISYLPVSISRFQGLPNPLFSAIKKEGVEA